MKPHPDKAILNRLFPYIRQYQELAIFLEVGKEVARRWR